MSEPELERWRAWRGVALIPPRPAGGRVRWRPGLAETIPAAEVDRVAEVARLVRRYRSLDEAGMILVARGELDQTGAGAVRDAFVAYWTRRLDRAGNTRRRERRLTRGPRSSRRRSTLVLAYRSAIGSPVDVEGLRDARMLRLGSLLDLEDDRLATEERLREALRDATSEDVCDVLRKGRLLASYRNSARRAYGHRDVDLDALRIAVYGLAFGFPSHEQVTASDELDPSTVALARRYLDPLWDDLTAEPRPRETERG